MRTLPIFALLLLPLIAADPGTKLTVQVHSALSGKAIERASVIVRFKEGRSKVNMKKITTSWETRTNQAGSVTIPAIPMGKITIQVIAQNFQTYGDVFDLDQPEQTIAIKLNPPQAQYTDGPATAGSHP